ncbi:hypothetical protein EDB83DRAFT_2364028 [Lactarius deliciosus]|nr:hypothetical protein EDB83DRAFT_2364028 [Lactarius deliciosus]
MRKNRLRVCLKCLWYILRAYSHPGVSQPLPSYFPNSLIPEIVRRVQTEEDFTLRAIGHCVIAVVISKLAADVKSRTIIVNDGVLTFLSPVLDTEGHDLEFLHNQPGTVALANMISLSFGEVGTLAAGAVPPDVLDLVQQTLTILSRALLAQEKAELQLGQEVSETDGSYRKFGRILVPHVLYFLNTGVRTPSRLTGEVRTSILRMCLKRLWFTGRAFNQGGKSMPSPSDLHITFSHPEMIRGIYEHQDPAVRTIGRCVGALVVNNLAVDLNSRIIPASHAELECLSTVLSIGDRSLEPLLLLRQPGAVSLATMISLVFDEAGTWATNTVPFGVPDMIQQTFIILSQTLLAELQPGRTITIIDGPDRKFERVLESHLFYFLTCIRRPWHLMEEARTSCLRMCLKGLWRVGRAFSQLRHSKPFLPYISMAFTIPRISELPDLAAREIGCCVGALVVKKIAADLISRTDSISGEELECLSAILGTEDNDVMRLLRHPGAIEFTNMVFLAANIDSLSARVPSDVLDVIRETFIILSHDLPDELNVKTWLDQTDTLINGSDGITSLNPDLYKRSLQMCLKNLWDVVRASNERGSSVPLPLYIYVAFTDSVMTRRIHKDADPTTALIGHCVGALLVNKHVSDLKSRAVPASDEELACISVILGTQSHNVTRWLRHPGATELAGVVSLVSDVVRSLVTSVVPSDVLDVVQQTLDLVSQALPEERIAQQQPDRTIPPISISDDDFERIISYNLEEFLKACISNTSPITMEVRTSCLRIFLKSLWYFARLYHQLDASTPMPSYFPLTYASTEITHLIQTELDPSTRVVGRCFEALVVDKLMEDTNSLTDEGVACISAILGKESHIVWHWLNQPGAIDLRNVISVISDEIDTFVADELSPDVLEILQQTLSIIARNIVRGHRSADEDLYMEQVLYFHSIFSIVADAGGADWFKYRLEWILSQLPAVEDRNRWRSDLISDRQLSEYGTDSDSTG